MRDNLHRHKQQQEFPCWAVNIGDDRRTTISIFTHWRMFPSKNLVRSCVQALLQLEGGCEFAKGSCVGFSPQRPLSQGLVASMGWSCPEAPCFKCLPRLLKTDMKKNHKTSVNGRTWYKMQVLLTFSILLMMACWLVYHWTNTLKALVA